MVYTDAALAPQGTLVKSAHLLELRRAVNAVRSLAGLTAADFTDAAPDVVRAIHIIELRAALNEARAALSLPAAAYVDPSLSAGATLIRALHVADLRAAVR